MGRAKIADWEKPGQFGDTYGAINALFSGLAFAGVIATVLLQRRELKLQRDELQEARKVQERSQEALSTQAHSLLIAAHLNALKARIEVYDVQIAEVAQRNDGARANSLRVERQSQWEELDDILKIAAHEQRKYAAIGTEPDPAAGLHEVAQ